MLQLIVGVVLIVIAFALLKHVFAWSLKLLGLAIGLALIVVAGIPVLLGFLLEKITGFMRLRLITAVLMLAATGLLSLVILTGQHSDLQNGGFAVYKYALPPLLFLIALVCHRRRVSAEKLSEPIQLFRKQDKDFFFWYFSAVFVFVAAIAAEPVYPFADWPSLAWLYWTLGTLGQLALLQRETVCKKYLDSVHDRLHEARRLNASAYLDGLLDTSEYPEESIEAIYYGVLAKQLKAGRIDEREIEGDNWVFNRGWHRKQLEGLDKTLSDTFRHNEDVVHEMVGKSLRLPPKERADYSERHLECGERYEFEDGNYFVHYIHASRVKKCVACGVAVERSSYDTSDGEWFCSDVCRETEHACVDIHKTPLPQFLGEAANRGFIVMAGAAAWQSGHKVFAAGGQGHGFAAEQVNHKVDQLSGKKATIVGGDNAKNGADRIVDGQQIQSKYCGTAARSVGAAFDGQQGSYRYIDESGKPMQLEVPKDQVADAIRTMEKKIAEGKVPGVSDPEEAGKLIRPGHLTYEQARNITKFGTIESLGYDLAEGVIVGLSAGGISFGITAFVYYLNTKDMKAALRVAVVQFGKTSAKTTLVYVSAQQLHRLQGVQSMLTVIDAEALSPGIRQFLEKGFGVSRNGVSNALRGTIVTSVVLVAVTTGPDLIKLVRGRMSKAQFLKNVAVASSGVAGGVVGSMVGGAAGMSLGPVGAVVGRVLGGMVGGMASAAIASAVAGTMMEEDRDVIVRIIQRQIEYLARTFILTGDELENLSLNLDKIIDQKKVENIFAARNRRAAANALVKPVVVSVVKQRPAISFNDADVSDACLAMAA